MFAELRTFVARTGSLQAKLTKTVKKNSGTRLWQSYYIVYDSGENKLYVFKFWIVSYKYHYYFVFIIEH
jgi:hypothetical protein